LFSAVSLSGVYFIVPKAVTGVNGQLIQQSSPFDALISIDNKNRSGMALVSDVLAAMTQKFGVKIGLGTVPTNMLMQTSATAGASSESARSVLTKALTSLRWSSPSISAPIPKIDWQLYYDANSKDYTFNAHVVMVESPSPMGYVALRPL
jgi:hypothetical protein